MNGIARIVKRQFTDMKRMNKEEYETDLILLKKEEERLYKFEDKHEKKYGKLKEPRSGSELKSYMRVLKQMIIFHELLIKIDIYRKSK